MSRRVWVIAAWMVLGWLLAALAWLIAISFSDRALQWTLERIPGLHVTQLDRSHSEGQDSLQIQQLRWQNEQVRVQADGLRMTQLRMQSSPWPLSWVADELKVQRLIVDWTDQPSDSPLVLPQSLPGFVSLQIPKVHIESVQLPKVSAEPMRQVSFSVDLQEPQWQAQLQSLRWGPLQAQGLAQVGSSAPLPVQLDLQLISQRSGQDSARPIEGWLRATGPLSQMDVSLDLPQTLRAKAQLQLERVWPLGQVHADVQSLNPADWWPGAHQARWAGVVRLDPPDHQGHMPLQWSLGNQKPGLWRDSAWPLKSLSGRGWVAAQSQVQWRIDEAKIEGYPSGQSVLSAEGAGPHHQGALQWSDWPLQVWLPQAGLDLRGKGSLDWRLNENMRSLQVPASQWSGSSGQLDLAGKLKQSAPGQALALQVQAKAQRLDLRPWWRQSASGPMQTTEWMTGQSLNLQFEAQAEAPESAWQHPDRLWQMATGQAEIQIQASQLAGMPIEGQWKWQGNPTTGLRQLDGRTQWGKNQISAEIKHSYRPSGSTRGQAHLLWKMPQLSQWGPLLGLWPALREQGPVSGQTEGSATASYVMAGPSFAQLSLDDLRFKGQGKDMRWANGEIQRWEGEGLWGRDPTSPWSLSMNVKGGVTSFASLQAAKLSLSGHARQHQLQIDLTSPQLPPDWIRNSPQLHLGPVKAGEQTRLSVQLSGSLVGSTREPEAWHGQLQDIQIQQWSAEGQPRGQAWLQAKDVPLRWEGLRHNRPMGVSVGAGQGRVIGIPLTWKDAQWQAGKGKEVDTFVIDAQLADVPVAPWLTKWQPQFGWGGNLKVGGALKLRSRPSVAIDVLLERKGGDLTVTDDSGTTPLGLTDLQWSLQAKDGVWSLSQGLAGKTLGVAAGAIVTKTSPQALFPPKEAPLQGVVELDVQQLSTWGTWLPAEWRLGGQLKSSAVISGQMGAPELTGRLNARQLSIRHFVHGIQLADGEVDLSLQGATARIERAVARGGEGRVEASGSMNLGALPQADLTLQLDRFLLLSRADRRAVVSGTVQTHWEPRQLKTSGKLTLDEAFFDWQQGDAPALGSDITVVRQRPIEIEESLPSTGPQTAIALDLGIDLGKATHLQGKGLQTRLSGALQLSSVQNKLRMHGEVNAVDGRYRAYGQQLHIDRGSIQFQGSIEDPKLDIEATRPHVDVRVGVAIGGSAQNPRVRLFSEPELSELDKLSWLVLGRGSDGLGRTDTALLQRAAMALLQGENPSLDLLKQLGLDELSIRQSDGSVRDTVVSMGKQLSRRWYVGYERSLNATAGSWQLIYRLAQKFTLRAQSGEEQALDLIWSWRWNP